MKENTGVEFAEGGGAGGEWLVREVQEFKVEKLNDKRVRTPNADEPPRLPLTLRSASQDFGEPRENLQVTECWINQADGILSKARASIGRG